MFTEAQKQSRGRTLAEAFFFRMDQELIESLRRKLNREEKIQAFQTVAGIRDQKVIEALVDARFDLSSITAFIWAPALFVAWADGNADQLETDAILESFPKKGVSQDVASMMISHEWFMNRPTEELWTLWEEFAMATLATLPADERESLMDEIINLCYIVAHASGGFLGIGKVSQSECDTIDRVIRSFNRDDHTNALDHDLEA